MAEAKPPVFVIDGNDVSIHSSLEDAALLLEATDVKRNLYVGYDSEGRLVRFESDRQRVKASLAEENPLHARELEEALRKYLRAMDVPEGNDSECNLPCLVEVSKRITKDPPRSFTAILKNLFTKGAMK